jgi:hypothetical protein
MPHVSVTIAGRHYRMACDEGQEEHLMRLARDIDSRILDLRGAFGEARRRTANEDTRHGHSLGPVRARQPVGAGGGRAGRRE